MSKENLKPKELIQLLLSDESIIDLNSGETLTNIADGDYISYRDPHQDRPKLFSLSQVILFLNKSDSNWQIKPKIISFCGFDYPEPVYDKPDVEVALWVTSISDPDYPVEANSNNILYGMYESGIVQATKEGAISQGKAILNAIKLISSVTQLPADPPISADVKVTNEVSNDIKSAMNLLTSVINRDEGYAWNWHCNMAICAMNEGLGHHSANKAAARFMYNLFSFDSTKLWQYEYKTPTEEVKISAIQSLNSL